MKEKFVKFIKDYFTDPDWNSFYKDVFHEDLYKASDVYKTLLDNNYVIKVVDHFGGEGQGDTYWSVFSVTHFDDVCYFKIDGWYASHYGAEISGGDYGFYEVKKTPVQTYEWTKNENSI